jgi:gliding motility-associated-like protein
MAMAWVKSTFVNLIFHTFCVLILMASFSDHGYGQDVEICNNAVDDDGDGWIDLNDPDCECQLIEPVSRIPNPSFEDLNCCPNDRSQLNCAEGWIQASAPTTDLIHQCGWYGWDQFPPPTPFPDGEGIMGFRDGRRINNNNPEYEWKEYAGACLTAPLLKGETYRFEFHVGFVGAAESPPLEVTFFGSYSCSFLPFGNGREDVGCPTNAQGWVKLGEVLVSGTREWVKSQIEITPEENLYAIAIGPPCIQTRAVVSTYYFFDNLILDELSNFEFAISEMNHPCGNQFALKIPERTGLEYQWYKEGIAIVGATDHTLAIREEGDYQVLISDGVSCKVTSFYQHRRPVVTEDLLVKVCDGEAYQFGQQLLTESGIFRDTLISVDGCDSVITLTIEGLTTIRDTMYETIFDGEKFTFEGRTFRNEGEHIVPLTDADGCDYFVHIFLEPLKVYFPNVFSPNNDGNNDLFTVYGGEELILVKELSVYDRWGGKVFIKENFLPNGNDGWDGLSGGIRATTGVYTFRSVLRLSNGQEKDFYGSVLLVN